MLFRSIARPTTSRVLYQQVVGRGLRPYPGKDACLVVDCVGATDRHNLMSLAGIAGLAEVMESQGDDDDSEDSTDKGKESHGETRTPAKTGLKISRTEEIAIHRKSALRWVTTRQGRHVLSFFDGIIRLEPASGGRELWQVDWIPQSGKPQRLASHIPLDYAMGAAEDTARDRERKLITRNASWLMQPPSEAQVRFARKIGIDVSSCKTRGEISNAITEITGDWK